MKAKANTNGAARPPRKLGLAALGTGLVLGAIAAGACYVDFSNNHQFGMSISHELGIVMGLSAVTLTLLPAAKPFLKANPSALRLVRLGTWVALAMTVLAALSAHMDKQAADRMHRQAQNDRHAAAQAAASAAERDLAAAKAEAAAITELSPSASLMLMADQSDADAKREAGNKFCGPLCRTYRAKADGYRERAGKAKAREDALTRVAEAQVRLDGARAASGAGRAEVSSLANVYAMQIGKDPADAARDIELLTAIMSILATVTLALLGEPAVILIRIGLGVMEQEHETEKAETRKAPAVITGKIVDKVKAAKRGRKPLTHEERILQFAGERLRGGTGETTGGTLYETFAEWWRTACPGATMPSRVALWKVLTDKAGIIKERRGGRARYIAELIH